MKFDYTISKSYDIQKYQKAKEIIKNKFPLFSMQNEIVDSLDGDMVQIFENGEDKIRLVNDYFVGAVYVESTVEINFTEF